MNNRVFTFTLPIGTITASASYDSYEGCVNPQQSAGTLIVSGFIPEDDVMKLRLNQMSPVDIGTTIPFQVCRP